MLGTILLLLGLLVSVQGYPTGPPPDVCGTMYPQHSVLAQTSNVPYTISFSKNTYMPNEQIQVTLQGSSDFKGFLIQPRKSTDNDQTYGSITSNPSNTRNPCNGGKVALSHTNNILKSSVTFTWQAPSTDEGPIVFVYTAVQDGATFWVKAESSPLTFQSDEAGTQPTQPATTTTTTTTTRAPTTVNVENSDRPTAITKDAACGVTKSCYPADCTSDCDYLVTWENVDTETMKFSMHKKTTSPNYFVAIGLSADPFMRDDSVTHCVSQDGIALVQSTYNADSADFKFNEPLDNPIFGVELIDSYYANGILSCTYHRKKNAVFANNAVNGRKKRAVADADTFFDIESDWFLFVAHGNAPGGTPGMHITRPVISDATIDFQTILGSGTAPTTDPMSEAVEVKKDSGCGSEVGCFHDCEGDSCSFLFTWKDDGGDEILFTCTCKQSGNRYCALGLSSDEKMGDDSVIACGASGGSTEVKNFYNDGNVCRPTTNPLLGLRIISSSNANGVLFASFARQKTVSDPQIFNLNDDWNLLYATGPYISGFVSKHSSRPQASKSKADFQKTEDLGAEESSVDLVYLHATFMVSAWMFFASFGIFTARYYKGVWPDDAKVCGEKQWFTIHRTCMILVFLLCVAGFVVIFVHVEGYSEIEGTRFEKSHPIIGIVVMGLALLNPTIALFRPHPGTRFRPVFNVFHSIFGSGAYTLSLVNVFSGTYLSTTNVPSYIRIVLYVFVGWIVLMEFVFIYLTHCRKKERSQDYEMTPKGSSSNFQPPKNEGEGFKSVFLVLHFLVLLGFASAIAIIVWTQRDDDE